MWSEVETIYVRCVKVMRLDAKAFAEVQADRRATYQALLVAIVASLCFAVHIRGGWSNPAYVTGGLVLLWFLLTGLIYLITTSAYRSSIVNPGFLPFARGMGYALAPGALRILLFVQILEIGLLGRTILFVAEAWTLAAVVTSVSVAFRGLSYVPIAIIVGVAMFPVLALELYLLR